LVLNRRTVSKLSRQTFGPSTFSHHRFNLQVRYYARQSSRKETDTIVEDQNKTSTSLADKFGAKVQFTPQPGEPEGEATEELLTPDTRRHLSKVYGTLLAGAGMSVAGVATAFALPFISLPAKLLGFIGIIAIAFMDKSKVQLRQNLFLGSGFFIGAGLATMVTSPWTVLVAALLTSGIFGGFTLAALKAKRKSMLMLGGVFFTGLLCVFGVSVGLLFAPMLGITNPAILSAFYNINIYLGLPVFSLLVAYDTQYMLEAYKAGDDDHVTPAVNLFLNLINIFVRLLEVFRK